MFSEFSYSNKKFTQRIAALNQLEGYEKYIIVSRSEYARMYSAKLGIGSLGIVIQIVGLFIIYQIFFNLINPNWFYDLDPLIVSLFFLSSFLTIFAGYIIARPYTVEYMYHKFARLARDVFLLCGCLFLVPLYIIFFISYIGSLGR